MSLAARIRAGYHREGFSSRVLTLTEALEDQFATMRREMAEQIARHARHVAGETGRSELSPRVLRAMEKVPRHEFVPAELRAFAYVDSPLPIGFDKTISQPFIVALMTDVLDLHPDDKVLEVGTGLGYQAAILSELGRAGVQHRDHRRASPRARSAASPSRG